MIKLNNIYFNSHARGPWCQLPYPGHEKGCPNYPQCLDKHPIFTEKLEKEFEWFAVIEEFNLEEHAKKMKEKHPEWTTKQCRNLLYWQKAVRQRLKQKAHSKANFWIGDIVLEIPEACGINVILTMLKAGVPMEIKNPKIIRKVMFVGKRRN